MLRDGSCKSVLLDADFVGTPGLKSEPIPAPTAYLLEPGERDRESGRAACELNLVGDAAGER